MKTLKSSASVFLCLVLLVSTVLAFTACSKKNNNKENSTNPASNSANVTVRYLNFKPEVADIYK